MRVAYDARRLFAELDKAVAEERQLDVDHERLKAEKSRRRRRRGSRPWRASSGMRSATPAVTNYVTYARARPRERVSAARTFGPVVLCLGRPA